MPEVEPRWKEGPRRRRPRVLRADPDRPLATRCQAAIGRICSGRAEHRHHIRRRSQGGGDGPDNTLDLCFSCHEHIHANPAWARARGLLGAPIETEEPYRWANESPDTSVSF
jgi:hypothetical protein